jgi:hypothetical protein
MSGVDIIGFFCCSAGLLLVKTVFALVEVEFVAKLFLDVVDVELLVINGIDTVVVGSCGVVVAAVIGGGVGVFAATVGAAVELKLFSLLFEFLVLCREEMDGCVELLGIFSILSDVEVVVVVVGVVVAVVVGVVVAVVVAAAAPVVAAMFITCFVLGSTMARGLRSRLTGAAMTGW